MVAETLVGCGPLGQREFWVLPALTKMTRRLCQESTAGSGVASR